MKIALLLLGCSISAFGAACTMQTINGSDIQNTSPAKLNSNFNCLNNNAPKIFSGAIVPATITGSRFGDFYLNTTTNLTYQCFSVSPPCTAVAVNNWVAIGPSGGGSIPITSNALRGNGAGAATAVIGTGTDCVLVNGSSGSCGGGGGTGNVNAPGTLTSTACVTGGGTKDIQTPSSVCAIDSSGNVVALSFASTDTSHSGGANFSGVTSGSVMLAAADIAGTAIVYVLPTTNGTAGQVLQDNGVIACPTLVAGSPSTCHQLTWATGSSGPIAFSTNVGNWWPFGNDFAAVGSNTIGAANVVLCHEFTPPMSISLGLVALEQIAGDAGKHWATALYSADGNTLIATGSTMNSAASSQFAETLVASLVAASTYNFCLASDSATVLSYGIVDSSASNNLFLNIDGSHPRTFTAANASAWSGTTPNFPSTLGARTSASKGQPWTMFYK